MQQRGLAHKTRILVTLAAAMAIGMPAGQGVIAQEPAVPVGVHLGLMLKTLSFDRKFAPYSENMARIGVLFQKSFRMSIDVSNQAAAYLGDTANQEAAGRRISVALLPYDTPAQLDSALVSDSLDVLYIAPLRSVDVSEIVAATRARHVLTMTGVPSLVPEGVSVGVGVRGGKPELLINQTAALAEGADFSSQLLRLAKVYEGKP
jgi:hypothetical protein